MPGIGLATLASLISAGVGAGTSIYEATKGAPSVPGPSPMDQLKAKLAEQKQTDALIASRSPDILERAGGGVSPQYTAKVAATSEGVPFNPGDVESAQLKAILGNMFGESGGGGTFG